MMDDSYLLTTLGSPMHGTPPTHVVRTRTALPVRPKPPLMSRHYASMGLDVGMRACVLPTGKSPPLTPLKKKCPSEQLISTKTSKKTNIEKTRNQYDVPTRGEDLAGHPSGSRL